MESVDVTVDNGEHVAAGVSTTRTGNVVKEPFSRVDVDVVV